MILEIMNSNQVKLRPDCAADVEFLDMWTCENPGDIGRLNVVVLSDCIIITRENVGKESKDEQ